MLRALLPLVCLCTAAAAQTAPPPAGGKPASPRQPEVRVVRGDCSEAQSRSLFTSCDADGDDRLDVFEAGEAIEMVHGARDVDGFARFDVDRDGFVTWREFDRALHTTLDAGATFRVKPARAAAPATPETKPLVDAKALLTTHDANRDGALDATELGGALRRVDARLATWAAELLRACDADRDGKLQPAELQKLPLAPRAKAAASTGS
jgi:Ca2+-binding EF-hand superfamily protein